MKRFLKISRMSAVFCVLLMSACQIQQQSAGTLPNGSDVTDQEKAQLDAMKPQVDQIIVDVTGSDLSAFANGKSVSFEQMSQVKARVETLLQTQFGNDYQKFIVEKEFTQPAVSNSGKSSELNTDSASSNIYSNAVGQQIGFWTSTSTIPNYAWQTISHTYSLGVRVGTTSLPWFSYNYATQNLMDVYDDFGFNSKTGSFAVHETRQFMAANQTIVIVDGNVQNVNTATNTNTCSVIGKIVVGFTAPSITTYHSVTDANVYNGSVGYGWIWSGY